MSTLELRSLTVRFGNGRHALTAVDGVDLSVPDGSVVGLVGESGSGKSTLARAVAGLTPVQSGQLLLDGQPLGNRRSRRQRRQIQMVFQDPAASLNPRMTAADTLSEALSARGVPRRERCSETGRLLELVRLDPDQAMALPRQLSGGQRQRVALARAIATEPELLICDEITSALDVSVQGAVLNLLTQLRQTLGLNMLFISHNMAAVRHMSDIIAVMYLGRIVEIAPTDQLLSNPQHPYTRLLIDSVPEIQTHPGADTGTQLIDAEPADPHRPPPGCRFHPRCAVGPVVDHTRDNCRVVDPQTLGAHRAHHAACHYAPALNAPIPIAQSDPRLPAIEIGQSQPQEHR
jgi:peptide/nickel transport system ATP-binding protein